MTNLSRYLYEMRWNDREHEELQGREQPRAINSCRGTNGSRGTGLGQAHAQAVGNVAPPLRRLWKLYLHRL